MKKRSRILRAILIAVDIALVTYSKRRKKKDDKGYNKPIKKKAIMKTISFDDYMASLPIERQKRINDRAAKLIAEIDSELPSAVANAFE